MSKVTVAMSVYARVRPLYVRETIESILGQTLKDLEFVIVVDGPVGNELRELLAHYARRDNRIRTLANESNMGSFFCMNLAIKENKSPYIARMDADDISLPQRLERQVDYLEAHPDIDMVGTFAQEIDEQGRVIFLKRMPLTMDEIVAWMPRRNPFIQPSVLFRRSFFGKVGLYGNYRVHEDTDLWIRMLKKGVQAANIPEFLLQFRVDKNFYHRRRGIQLARTEFGLRVRCIRELGLPRINYLFVALMFVLRLCPTPIVKLMYLHFR